VTLSMAAKNGKKMQGKKMKENRARSQTHNSARQSENSLPIFLPFIFLPSCAIEGRQRRISKHAPRFRAWLHRAALARASGS
jgi:hypothetical protein